MVAFTHQQIDDSPLVKARAPRVTLIDSDGNGEPDVHAYDVNHDGVIDIEHHVADRRTVVYVPSPPPWEAPPTLTSFTGEPNEVSLRVCFRICRIGDTAYELNGSPTPTCIASHGMLSLNLLWNAEREHRDEVQAAQAFWLTRGGIGGFERA
jgi:hypothetical protein